MSYAQLITERIVKDPTDRQKIIDQYSNLGLLWLQNPRDNEYSSTNNIRKLSEPSGSEKAVRSLATTPNVYAVFSDPTLSYFNKLNAFYLPNLTYGKKSIRDHIQFTPMTLAILDKNPFAFFTTLAHEVCHKIDIQNSEFSGFDMSSNFSSLISCFKSEKSIRMKDDQTQEAICDSIAAEILANQISKMPSNMRVPALRASMYQFCVSNSEIYMNVKRVHTDSTLRIAGIFGANPNIRKTIGCTNSSSKYKSCGLEKIKINENAKISPKSKN